MESLFSDLWYRVAGLKPRLRSHTQIHRHQYRGETWYVLQDLAAGRFHRFSPAAYGMIGLMDGRRTVQEIWEHAAAQLGDDAPTQDETIRLLSQLYSADALQCDVPPETADLLLRHDRQRRRKWFTRLMNPFAWQFPLFDPERFLQWALPLVRPLFGWFGGVLWCGVVGAALVGAGVYWPDLSENFVDRVLSPQNLLFIWLLFPVIKFCHEFGHAFATKVFGGEVHDMGIMLLVFTPVPYVNASAASAFRDKWQRIIVGAAGMAVEVFLASLALFLWVNAEPGTVRTLAYNAMLIAGITTVAFNANPLMRFDGYYMLADFLEIPNLRQRGAAYCGYLCERYLFGHREAEAPSATRGERAWFVSYTVISFVYRLFVVVAIVLFLTDQYFWLGMFFAGLTSVIWVGVPAVKGLNFVFKNPRIRRVRTRAIATSVGAVAVLASLVFLVPVPWRTRAEGVVWLPDESFVRAGTEGFIERVLARPGTQVRRGDPLIACRDEALTSKVKVLQHRLQELRARYHDKVPKDLVQAEIVKEEYRYVEESLTDVQKRADELVIRSQADGTFVAPLAQDLEGRFVKQGQLLAHVVDLSTLTVRMVVPQGEVDLIRQQTRQVDVRLTERLEQTVQAVIKRIVPAASDQLPSQALSVAGGGQFALDPMDPHGMKTIKKVFQIDLELPTHVRVVNVGGRALVRFDHGWAPLATQWYREIRQLFLSRFNV